MAKASYKTLTKYQLDDFDFVDFYVFQLPNEEGAIIDPLCNDLILIIQAFS